MHLQLKDMMHTTTSLREELGDLADFLPAAFMSAAVGCGRRNYLQKLKGGVIVSNGKEYPQGFTPAERERFRAALLDVSERLKAAAKRMR